MNSYYLDSKIRQALNEDISIPESYFENISSTIYYCKQNEIKLKKKKTQKHSSFSIIQKFVATIIAVLTCATVYAISTGNIDFNSLGLLKVQNNYEDNKLSITDEKIENDYFTLSIESIARDSVYTIVEYKVILTELGLTTFNDIKEFTVDDTFNRTGYSLTLCSNAFIGDSDLIYLNSYANTKVSDNEYIFVQTINTIDYPDQDIALSIWLDKLTNDGSNSYVKINKLITLTVGLNSKNSNSFETKDYPISDTQTIRINNIINSKFETCVDITRIIHNLTIKEYNDSFKLYEIDGYVLTDENNNTIRFSGTSPEMMKKIFNADTNHELSSGELASIDENTNIRIEERRILNLDKSINPKEIAISSSHFNIPNERTSDEKDRFFNYDWYDLKEDLSNITFTSPAGGTITIDAIEITNDTIDFYFTQKGAWLNGPIFSIRKNNGKYSHYSASKIEHAGLNSMQNKASFFRKEGVGISVSDYTDDLEAFNKLLIDMDNLQFSVYDFAYNYELFDITKVAFPEEIKENASIKNIKVEDTNTTILELKIYSLHKDGINRETTKYEDLENPNFVGRPLYTTFYEVDYTNNNKIINNLTEIFHTDWYWFENLKDLSIYKNNATGLIEILKNKFEKSPEKAIVYEVKSNEFVSSDHFQQ